MPDELVAQELDRHGGRAWQALVALTLQTYGDKCHLCERNGATSADHLIPRSKGGRNELTNLRPAHLRCNQQRGARMLARPPITDNTEMFKWTDRSDPAAS